MPWLRDLQPTLPLMPVRKKKLSRAARKRNELTVLRKWVDRGFSRVKAARGKKGRKNYYTCKCTNGDHFKKSTDDFEKLLRDFKDLNESKPVSYKPLTPELKQANPRVRSRTFASCLLQHVGTIPVPKVPPDLTLYRLLEADPVNERFWNDIIQTRLQGQKSRETTAAVHNPDLGSLVLQCGDVHPNPGPTGSTATISLDLKDNEKRWLIVGLALEKVVVPNLRPFLDSGLQTVYTDFKTNHAIDRQTSRSHLKSCPTSGKPFSYKLINGNDSLSGSRHLDYKVGSHVDLAKLYLRDLFMSKFTAVNEECDPSAVLNLLGSVPAVSFTPAIQTAVKAVRLLRNCWAHCNITNWDITKLKTSFQEMNQLVTLCSLAGAAKELKELEDRGAKNINLCGVDNLVKETADLRTDLTKWKTVEQQKVDKIVKKLDAIVDTLRRIEQGVDDLKGGQKELKEGQEQMKRGQDEMKKGQDEMKKGQDEMKKGQAEMKKGQDEMKKEQAEMKLGQDEMKRGQEEMKKGQDEMKKGQDEMKLGQDEIKRGEDEMKRGQVEMKKGQEEMKKGQEEMKKSQEEMKKNQVEMKKGQEEMMKNQEEKAEDLRKRMEVLSKSQAELKDLVTSTMTETKESDEPTSRKRSQVSNEGAPVEKRLKNVEQKIIESRDISDAKIIEKVEQSAETSEAGRVKSTKMIIETVKQEVRSLKDSVADTKLKYEAHCSHTTSSCDYPYQELTEKLKNSFLSSTETLEELFEDFKVDDIFTNLVIQCGRVNYAFKDKPREEISVSYTSATDTVIERAEQLFMPNKDTQNPKLILLTGRAGIGKTMFSMKLVREWASDRLFSGEEYKNKFRFVFLYSFRLLNDIDGPLTLHEFLNLSHELNEDEFEYIRKHPETTLIIMDGFDEFKRGFQARSLQEIPKENKMSVAAVCAKLSAGKLLSGANVVVTSRPKESEQLELIKFQRKCEILGFAPQNVEQYFTNFFKDNIEMAETVLNQIQENAALAGICYIPVNCFIMCSLFQWLLTENACDSTKHVKLPSTVTELYEGVLHMFVQKHHREWERSSDIQEFSAAVTDTLDKLSVLALKMFETKKYVFNESDLRKALNTNEFSDLVKSGFIHSMPRCRTGPYKVETQYCFIHLTFQEFLAARKLVQMRQPREIQSVIRNGSEVVIQFVSGFLRNVPTSEDPAEQMDIILSELLKSGNRLVGIRCLFEYGDRTFAKHVLKKHDFTNLELQATNVNSSDCAALAFLLTLDVESSGGNCHVTHLYLDNNNLGDTGARYVSEALSSGNCHLTLLSLSGNNIGDAGAQYVSEALRSGNCQLTVLTLENNNLGDAGAQYVSEALRSGNCQLTKLYLDKNNIGDAGAQYVSEALRSGNCQLTVLSLDNNNLGDAGAQYVSEALRSGNCQLTLLYLDNNNIGDAGARYVSEALRSGNCQLTELYLSNNNIGDAGAQYVSEAISSGNCHLTLLYLYGNNIGDAGAQYVSEALRSGNCQLTQFYLDGNNIVDAGAQYESEALRIGNCQLTHLSLGNKN